MRRDNAHDESPIFAYVVMKLKRLAAFRKALLKGNIDLGNFGVVVAQGAGHEPPPGFESKVLEFIGKEA